MKIIKYLWKKYKNWKEKPIKKMIDDYIKIFPDRCIICSYHVFGLREGLTSKPYPEPHYCVNKKKYVNYEN